MAVDGRKLSDTLRLGSDVFNEHPCSPCAKDNRQVEAIKYCVDCDENICGKCDSDHKRFAVMRGHQIEDKPRTQAGQNRLDLPTTRCDKHGGKLIDVYCPSHDTVGCTTCIAVEHSTCHGIQYIPNVAKEIGKSKELQDLEARIKSLQQQLDSLKLRKLGYIKHIQQEKENILKEIKDLRKVINDHLDKMEEKLLNEVDILFDQKLNDTNKRINKIDDITSAMNKKKKNIQDGRNANEAELFVQLKSGLNDVKENEGLIKELNDTIDERPMELYTSEEIEKFLTNKEMSLASIVQSCESKLVLHVKDVDVSLVSDRKQCYISDIICLDNGNYVIADFRNSRLKMLDHSYLVAKSVDLPCDPYGLCEVEHSSVAVTLSKTKTVRLVCNKTLALQNSFPVGDFCRGIAFYHGLLYVCCGGRTENGEGQGHIEVYNRNGNLLRSLYNNANIHIPGRICFSKHRYEMIIGNGFSVLDGNFLSMEMYKYGMAEIKVSCLKKPCGICRIGDRHICIVGQFSNNVIITDEDGRTQRELLTQKQGIKKPVAVCFNENHSTLLLSEADSNVLKVFKLEY